MVEEPVLSMRFSDGQWLRATYADVGGGGALILNVLPDDPDSLAPSRQDFGDLMGPVTWRSSTGSTRERATFQPSSAAVP